MTQTATTTNAPDLSDVDAVAGTLADIRARGRCAIPVLLALLMPVPSAAQSPASTGANPQAPVGEASPTAPNAQGMMTNPGPGGPSQAPSGVPGSVNVNPNEPARPMPTPPLPADSPAPRAPDMPSPAAR
jgi:hypothetical protein